MGDNLLHSVYIGRTLRFSFFNGGQKKQAKCVNVILLSCSIYFNPCGLFVLYNKDSTNGHPLVLSYLLKALRPCMGVVLMIKWRFCFLLCDKRIKYHITYYKWIGRASSIQIIAFSNRLRMDYCGGIVIVHCADKYTLKEISNLGDELCWPCPLKWIIMYSLKGSGLDYPM